MKKVSVKKKNILHKKRTQHHHERPIRWLPIDSRLITPFFKFSSVTGVARIFLELEITLTIFVVLGTLVVAVLKLITFLN